MDESCEPDNSFGRRDVLKGSAAVWMAPTIISIAQGPPATGSTIRPYIVSSQNVQVLDPPPPSIVRNVMESDSVSFVFQETTCAPTTQDVVVNRATDGLFLGNTSENAIIPAGTPVASFIVVVDRATNGVTLGSVTFSDPIAGLIYLKPQFDATTPLFGLAGTTYPNHNGTYFEGNDGLTLAGETFAWDAFMGGQWADVARVLVEC